MTWYLKQIGNRCKLLDAIWSHIAHQYFICPIFKTGLNDDAHTWMEFIKCESWDAHGFSRKNPPTLFNLKHYSAAAYTQETNMVKQHVRMCHWDFLLSDPLLQEVFVQPQVMSFRLSRIKRGGRKKKEWESIYLLRESLTLRLPWEIKVMVTAIAPIIVMIIWICLFPSMWIHCCTAQQCCNAVNVKCITWTINIVSFSSTLWFHLYVAYTFSLYILYWCIVCGLCVQL